MKKMIISKPVHCALCGIIIKGYATTIDIEGLQICDLCADEIEESRRLDKLNETDLFDRLP